MRAGKITFNLYANGLISSIRFKIFLAPFFFLTLKCQGLRARRRSRDMQIGRELFEDHFEFYLVMQAVLKQFKFSPSSLANSNCFCRIRAVLFVSPPKSRIRHLPSP